MSFANFDVVAKHFVKADFGTPDDFDLDNFFIDTDNSTGVLDTSAKTYAIGPSQILQSREFALEGTNFTAVTPGVTFDVGTMTISLKNANISFESGTNNVEHVFSNVGDSLKYKLLNTGGATITISAITNTYR